MRISTRRSSGGQYHQCPSNPDLFKDGSQAALNMPTHIMALVCQRKGLNCQRIQELPQFQQQESYQNALECIRRASDFQYRQTSNLISSRARYSPETALQFPEEKQVTTNTDIYVAGMSLEDQSELNMFRRGKWEPTSLI